jgi:F-type H+-transporting ATPase subunit gamma
MPLRRCWRAMADDLAAVRARIRGVRQLDAVIGVMRGIAAAHAQQSRGLLPGIGAYAGAIAHAIASALRLREEGFGAGPRNAGAVRIVFTAEQGFAGAFTERILDAASARSPAAPLLIGSRGLAAAHGISPVWQSPMATHVDGVAPLCIRIADALYALMTAQPIGLVEVLFPAWSAGGDLRIECQRLLPLHEERFAHAATGVPPLVTLPPDALLTSLAEEYVYAALCEAAMHAFVAENEARAAAMSRARGKVQEMLAALHLSENRVRQEAITAEIVELAGGGLLEPGAGAGAGIHDLKGMRK